jgi:hypothetical protein
MMAATRFGVRNWIADTLTETVYAFGQLAASRQAVRTTQSPIVPMMPISSAIGMNSMGTPRPGSGFASAAAPRIP